jgi:antitoxin component YwqK of YwqJK toxin-antitoxin module
MEEHQIACYICFEKESTDNLYASNPPPCICKGSITIHISCLERVIGKSRDCGICKTHYNVAYLPSRNGYELIKKEAGNGSLIEYTINSDKKKHGTYTLKDVYGQVLIMHSYINGVMEGPWVEYYPSGQIKSICKCKNNKIHGNYTEWYEDGAMREESNYKDGKKHGECTRWKRDGPCRVGITVNYIEGEAQPDEDEDQDEEMRYANDNEVY